MSRDRISTASWPIRPGPRPCETGGPNARLCRPSPDPAHALPRRRPTARRASPARGSRHGDTDGPPERAWLDGEGGGPDRKSTRLNSSHGYISYAVFCLKKKKKKSIADTSIRTSH